MAKIAFIGLGNMGEPMAANLLKAGHILNIFDLVDAPLKRLEKIGAHICLNAKQSVENVDFVISMLPASRHVEGLYLGEEGLLNYISKETLVIDCSTIDISTTKKLSFEAINKGISMLDAPVSGGVNGATAGSLSFMVGSSKEMFTLVETILKDMGENIFHAGNAGSGQMAKACNNMLLGILMA